jgi:cysteine-rich repeat protein
MRGVCAAIGVLLLLGCGGEPEVDAGTSDAGPFCETSADGTACGDDLVCAGGLCVESVCGDGFVDSRSEDCEDGNDVAFDGCDPGTCRFSCTEDSQCDDGEHCNGSEGCRGNVCVSVAPADPPCEPVPGSITALGGARTGGVFVVSDERFEGLGYGCGGAICAAGRIGP